MKLHVAFKEDPGFKVRFVQTEQYFQPQFGEINVEREHDYNKLINLPRINGVELIGNKTGEELDLGSAVFPSDGQVGDILTKLSSDVVGWITPASSVEQDNTRPITAAAVYTEIGNIHALLEII